MKYYFLTLFPEIFHCYYGSGMMSRGVETGILDFEVINIRDFTENKHKKTDDYPFGGGAGMVMTPQPIVAALKSIENYESYPIIYLTPSGKPFKQSDSTYLSREMGIIFICGHYEGIDQRVIDHYITHEFSVGDYVLTGGELPALTLSDCIARHIPGFLGNKESLEEESFEGFLLEYPHYTRPRVFEEASVPEVLLSGDHKKIADWRKEKSEVKTKTNRPDLYEKYRHEKSRKS